jgi:ketosteroid isomerase-like protein
VLLAGRFAAAKIARQREERRRRREDQVMGRARDAVLAHVRNWNGKDRDAEWALFADDLLYEDPPGTHSARGKQAYFDHGWDRAMNGDGNWTLEPVLVVEGGNEAQVFMRNHGTVDGKPFVLESIELWRVTDDGLVDTMRAFWELPEA